MKVYGKAKKSSQNSTFDSLFEAIKKPLPVSIVGNVSEQHSDVSKKKTRKALKDVTNISKQSNSKKKSISKPKKSQQIPVELEFGTETPSNEIQTHKNMENSTKKQSRTLAEHKNMETSNKKQSEAEAEQREFDFSEIDDLLFGKGSFAHIH